ncbi:sensor histidine kinase [Nitrincola sp. MINF-07-Sa-05]|uniref:sensor histidine kinase n=1 Tax=Nitrincola salilacus TaxID=3400273 RepID=UPI003918254E
MNKTSLPSSLPLPTFCRSKMVLMAIILAQAVAVLLALAPGVAEDRWQRLSLSTLFVQWVALLTIFLLCHMQKRLSKLTPRILSFSALGILLVVTLLVSLAAFSTLTHSGWQPRTDLNSFILHNLLIALVVGVIGLQFFIMHYDRSQNISAQSRAELDALQARIRPHFLFNTLNTVAELTRANPQEAEAALLNLSDLFRAALKAGDTSSLSAEIVLARQYLDLEKWRLGKRLRVSWQLPDHLADIETPGLILQPLIENAVHHGIEPCAQGGEISVELLQSPERITLLIFNPLTPKQPHDREQPHSRGNGVALDNIRQRLELFYGDQASLITSAHEGLFRAKLVLPTAR